MKWSKASIVFLVVTVLHTLAFIVVWKIDANGLLMVVNIIACAFQCGWYHRR